jgi:hypothetical protein
MNTTNPWTNKSVPFRPTGQRILIICGILFFLFFVIGPWLPSQNQSTSTSQSTSTYGAVATNREALMDQCLGLNPGTWNQSMAESNGARPGVPGELRCERIVAQQLMDQLCSQHPDLKCR